MSESKKIKHVKNFPHILCATYFENDIVPSVALDGVLHQEVSRSFFMHFLCEEFTNHSCNVLIYSHIYLLSLSLIVKEKERTFKMPLLITI